MKGPFRHPTDAPRRVGLRRWLTTLDLVLIAGTYKTGTSLAASMCSGQGFTNPSELTNPNERAYGLSVDRYFTRECKVLRSLNERLLYRCHGDLPALKSYLLDWDRPLVLKDPRFCFTLSTWIVAAKELRLSVGVVFTRRLCQRELLEAWHSAPVTRDLLARSRFNAYIAGLNEQITWVLRNRIPYLCVNLQELKMVAHHRPFKDNFSG